MGSQGTGDSDYVDIPAMVEGYKPPCPPKWKKRDVFDKQKMRELDEKAKQVTITSSMTFEDLAFELTNGLKNDLQRVRSLFVWLGGEDMEGQVYPKVTDVRTPLGFMKLMKNEKGTYAEFFAQLCRAANLPCVILEGNCKGANYEVGEQDVSNMRVTWNAVFIDGSWQIVHPMWAFTAVSGHDTGKWTKIEVEGKGTRVKAKASEGVTIRRIADCYFLPHPDEFIYKCIADKKDWQLLKQPWDLQKYWNVPHFNLEYFTSDYKLTSQHQAILVSIDGKCELEFLQKEGATSNLTYELFFDEVNSGEKLPADVELPRTVFFETNGNNLRLLVRFHIVGIHKLSISAGDRLVEFRLEAKERSDNENVFPVNPPTGFGFGQTAIRWGLFSPSHTSGVVVTQRNTVETFSFTMTRITQILARLRHVRIDSDTLSKYVDKTIIGNNVSIKVTMPDDSKDEEYALQVYTEYERQENNVLNYLLTNRKGDFEKESEKQKVRKTMQEKQKVRNNMQEKRIRRHLATALILKTVAPLERSVREFEEADLKDIDGQFRRGT